MIVWLHFIGQQYYKKKEFIREANLLEFCRRVAANVACKMNFGDMILFAQNTDRSGAEIFCQGKIIGVRSDIPLQKLKEKGITIDLYPGEYLPGIPEMRECGKIICGTRGITEDSLPKIADEIIKENPKAKMFVIGSLIEKSDTFDFPFFLKNVPFRQGFRELDSQSLIKCYQEKKFEIAKSNNPQRPVRIYGLFYPSGKNPEIKMTVGEIQEITDYQKKE
jgi:hypothetical protein